MPDVTCNASSGTLSTYYSYMPYSMEKQWTNIDPKQAVDIQKELRLQILIQPFDKKLKFIAGADASLEKFGTDLYAGIVVLSYPDLRPVCHALSKVAITFPYVPGLLSFREIPGLVECFNKLPVKPHLIIVDGQGIAHPRRLGIASHLGLVTGIPTVGCAKTRLFGAFRAPIEPGESSEIKDSSNGDFLGYAYKSNKRSNPLIISPGHLIDQKGALEIVKSSIRDYKLPEPTRLAHDLVNKFRRGEVGENS